MDKNKTKAFFAFLTVVFIFIISSSFLGEYHSSLSVVLGFFGGFLFSEHYDGIKEKVNDYRNGR